MKIMMMTSRKKYKNSIILNEKNELLVCRRAEEPAKGTLDLTGGFVDLGETAEEAIQLFYDSKQFQDYVSSQKTRFLDEQFVKSKGFSLLDKNAFFKLTKKNNNTA